jgi:hypothetical protein
MFASISRSVCQPAAIVPYCRLITVNLQYELCPILELRRCNFTHFDTSWEGFGNQIKLTHFPEDLVFDEMPDQPANAFGELMNTNFAF